jgi:hypothetical protein
MNDLFPLSPAQLRRAADLKERIEKLTSELTSLLRSDSPTGAKRGPGRPRKEVPLAFTGVIPPKKRHRMSAQGRARIAAAAKARWAKVKAEGKTRL